VIMNGTATDAREDPPLLTAPAPQEGGPPPDGKADLASGLPEEGARPSSSGNGPSGNGPSGNGPSGNGPSGNGSSPPGASSESGEPVAVPEAASPGTLVSGLLLADLSPLAIADLATGSDTTGSGEAGSETDVSDASVSSAPVSEASASGALKNSPPSETPSAAVSRKAAPKTFSKAASGTARKAPTGIVGFLDREKVLFAILFAVAVRLLWPDSGRHPEADAPYLAYALGLCGLVYALRPIVLSSRPELLSRLMEKDLFTAVAFLLLAALDILTAKATILPTLFFPTPDRILAVLVEDFRYLVIDCLGSSAKLLLAGFFSGAAAGLLSGILIGFSRNAAYWLNPLIKFLGPIPPTAWIPIVLVAFPTTWTGAVFLIALSVWFPTAVMTSSGILNVQNAYFEVSSTLGAKRFYQISMVGIPAAMPLIFTGLFSGACASFLTLMTAEMIGVKNGIGWYVHWQRQMLSYANVYAALIVIAVTFYSLITLFFKVRDRMLVWQKGVIKW
jgi:NitT/TauT family transport system permease protein